MSSFAISSGLHMDDVPALILFVPSSHGHSLEGFVDGFVLSVFLVRPNNSKWFFLRRPKIHQQPPALRCRKPCQARHQVRHGRAQERLHVRPQILVQTRDR